MNLLLWKKGALRKGCYKKMQKLKFQDWMAMENQAPIIKTEKELRKQIAKKLLGLSVRQVQWYLQQVKQLRDRRRHLRDSYYNPNSNRESIKTLEFYQDKQKDEIIDFERMTGIHFICMSFYKTVASGQAEKLTPLDFDKPLLDENFEAAILNRIS